MMGRLTRFAAICISAGLLGLASACGSSPDPQLYLLSSTASPSEGASPVRPFTGFIGVGPVALPKYLDSPEILTRGSANRIEREEYERWAEPLEDGLARVVAEDLAALLGHEVSVVGSWLRTAGPEFQLLIDVSRFDLDGAGGAVLRARWVFVRRGEAPPLLRDTASVREPIDGDDYEARVAALSRAVGALSREVADAIRGLPRE